MFSLIDMLIVRPIVNILFIIYTKEIATIDFSELRGLIHNLLIEAKII